MAELFFSLSDNSAFSRAQNLAKGGAFHIARGMSCSSERPDIREQSYLTPKTDCFKSGGVHIQTFMPGFMLRAGEVGKTAGHANGNHNRAVSKRSACTV